LAENSAESCEEEVEATKAKALEDGEGEDDGGIKEEFRGTKQRSFENLCGGNAWLLGGSNFGAPGFKIKS
jgi:hypothetical protein